ncbi:ABC transporter ATP-binding protein [Guptibacillus hwajinpoensis]|uniref:ABC-2 type transport system ATP-binding protein n=1 Tax=Guptibacillus hwajinpoensis TaxID=208199 RepID=A0ABU0JZD9_9BACL|nr:ABC transporter ATP-binding protein [Alkalihalobacillus hemicentroti]MDQ0482480.1 ABC-2 type transport system ATP-binding protein [Alkalihalobacillus hemicentroti]
MTLTLQDLTFIKNNKKILKNINFSLEKGETLGIIGPNGAGKSTLFKVIAGLGIPTSGNVIVDNESVFDKPHLQSKIGCFIENPVLYPYMTANENINIHLNLFKCKENEFSEVLIEQLGIEKFKDLKVKNYSLGMKQRLGIACSLIHNPDIVLLDEPTNALDVNGVKVVKDLIKYKTKNKKIILSSHRLSEIEELCDKIIIMNNGEIVEQFNTKERSTILKTHYIINVDTRKKDLKLNTPVSDLQSEGSEYKFLVSSENMNYVLKELGEKNIKIISMANEEKNLEDYFMERIMN